MQHRVAPAVSWLPIVALLLLAALPGCQKKISTDSIAFITPARVGEQIAKDPDKHLVLDARDPQAFQEGHLPGARRISVPDIDPNKRDPLWERYRSIVVYGENPGSLAAEAVTKRLMSAGYGQVYLMDGGFDAWKSSGRPVQD